MSITHQITITTNQGESLIDAYRHGKFAVHLDYPETILEPDEARYSITHIATGLQVICISGRASARKYARMLDAEITHDITATDYKNKTDDWKRFQKALAALVKRND